MIDGVDRVNLENAQFAARIAEENAGHAKRRAEEAIQYARSEYDGLREQVFALEQGQECIWEAIEELRTSLKSLMEKRNE